MPTEEVASLAKLMEQICLASDTVLGSDLGNAARIRFPDLNLRLQFGGLRKFIQDYCAGQIIYVRAQGGDGVYAHVSKVGCDARAAEIPTSTPTAWATLVDPNVDARLAVDPVLGSVHVCAGNDEIPESLIRVDKISLEDHRAIAKGFLPLTPVASRSSFESALGEDQFWPKWTAAFKTLSDRDVYAGWMNWRHEKLIALFEARLRSANLADDAIAFATSELQKSKQVKSALAKSTPGIGTSRPRGSASYSSHSRMGEPDARLRELAHSVINSMSDGDIRRIWLPFGAVTDALRRKN